MSAVNSTHIHCCTIVITIIIVQWRPDCLGSISVRREPVLTKGCYPTLARMLQTPSSCRQDSSSQAFRMSAIEIGSAPLSASAS